MHLLEQLRTWVIGSGITEQRQQLHAASEEMDRAVRAARQAEADMVTGIEGDALAIINHDDKRKKANGGG